MNMDKGHVSLLLLLDLSAAFNTVHQGILLQSLQKKLGVCVTALSWFKSYLEGRSQRICINETLSQPFDLKWGVPQVSCLGPLLFTIYTQDLFSKCLWSLKLLRPKVVPYDASASRPTLVTFFATVLNAQFYRDRQNFCSAKAWLHRCVVTQLENR